MPETEELPPRRYRRLFAAMSGRWGIITGLGRFFPVSADRRQGDARADRGVTRNDVNILQAQRSFLGIGGLPLTITLDDAVTKFRCLRWRSDPPQA